MPLYEYKCESCHERFERIQKFSDPPPEVCPKCGKGPVTKLLSSPAFQFKGSGWYVTDYARKSSGDAGKSGDGDKSGDGGKSGDSKSSAEKPSTTSTETSTASKPADTSTKKD